MSTKGLERVRKANEARFIADAKARFSGRFDYGAVTYRGQKVRVRIICPVHGAFLQTPSRHLQSLTGCPQCGVARRSSARTTEGKRRFLAWFKDTHGERLRLVSEYLGAREAIRVVCRLHSHAFETTPDQLASYTFGCHECAGEARRTPTLSAQAFAQRVERRYDGLVVAVAETYSGVAAPVQALCVEHGPFVTVASSLLYWSAEGCPLCARLRIGYAGERIERLQRGECGRPRATRIALMEVEVFGLRALKLGVTYRPLRARYGEALVAILFEARLQELDALLLERYLHAAFDAHRDDRIRKAGMRAGRRWSGDTECYYLHAAPALRAELRQRIAALSEGDPEYWAKNPSLERPQVERRGITKRRGEWNGPRRVLCVTTRQRFPSATAAARALGLSQGNVSSVCNGVRRATKGLVFRYLDVTRSGKHHRSK